MRIGSLLGLEQVGQCVFIEYEDDLIVVDAGMEFSANETLGADYIVPDIRYIKQNKRKLKGIVLSHGHLDHIGGLRDMLPELDYPTIYTTPLTLGIVKKLFDNKADVDKIKYKIIDPDIDILKLGCFTIEFVRVNHNIPETNAMAIHTPKGLIFNSSDFKFDHTPAIDKPADIAKIARIGLEGVKLYIGDSLGSQKK
ncbi:MAG: ribonuclease J [Candidatus Peribacteria bacterium]|nr:MAG: ribonuclease J [Candidatus Peribacteria bacterium]